MNTTPEPAETAPAPEYELNLDTTQKPQHNWVRRGLKLSCEGANHPNHSHILVGKVVAAKTRTSI